MSSRESSAEMNRTDTLTTEEKPLKQLIDEEITSGRAAPPVMPQVGLRIREITQKEDYSLTELTDEIERGPALAARVLRYANSSAYAGLMDITNLHQAVTRLGARMVESIAVAAATRELYQANSETERERMEALWKHSVATGETGRIIAQEVGSQRPEDIFLTCLLHDLGRVVILRALTSIEKRFTGSVGEGLRHEILESLHAECGARLLDTWKVPDEICEAVLHHHNPEKTSSGSKLPHVVRLADMICHKLGYSDRPDPDVSLLSLPSSTFLRLDDLRMAALIVNVEEALPRTAYLA